MSDELRLARAALRSADREIVALRARITELEAEVAARKRSGEALTTECEQIGEKADEAWRALNPYMARVELLTAALGTAVEALGWASDYVAVPWPKAYEPLRMTMAAAPTEAFEVALAREEQR